MDRRLRSLLWLALALVPLIVVMTVTVRGLLQAEGRARAVQREAQALIAVDAVLSALLLSEALQPAEAWQAFHHPHAARDGGKEMIAAFWRVPSALLAGAEPPARLHFQVSSEGSFTSPQVPEDGDRLLAAAYQDDDSFQRSRTLLQQLAGNSHPWNALRARLPALAERPTLVPDARRESPAQVAAARIVPDASMFPSDQDQTTLRGSLARSNDAMQQRGLSQSSGSIYAQPQAALEDRVRLDEPVALTAPLVRVGLMQALWAGDDLFLLRRADLGAGEVLQGVWLDVAGVVALCAPTLETLLPGARLLADDGTGPEALRLVSLPLRLEVPAQHFAPEASTRTLLWSLVGAALLAVGAAGLLLVVAGTLAERRAAFVSAVTHELRTPLTALRLHADLLADARIGGDAERRSGTVAILRSQAARLAGLIDNVLDYARLERRRSPRCETVDLPALMQRDNDRWRTRLAEVGLALDLAADGPPCAVQADPDALRRILDNLIDNAAKYAHAGTPPVVVLSWKQDRDSVRIVVRDHGPGLPQGRIPRPGERSAELAAGQAPGIGLGLELCRRLARSMGGSLQLSAAQPGVRAELQLRLAAG